jgi:hypothetical protein
VKYLKNTHISNVGINKDLTPQERDGGVKEEHGYAARRKGKKLVTCGQRSAVSK